MVHMDILDPTDLEQKLLTKYVAKRNLHEFKHHILELGCKAQSTVSGLHLSRWTGSLLLRDEDLPRFLLRLQGLIFVFRADHVYVLPNSQSSAHKTQFKLRDPVMDWSFTIDLPQSPLSRNDLSAADRIAANTSLLQLFKNLAGTSNQVTLKGAASHPSCAELCNHLNSRVVSVDAMGVHLLDVLRRWEESLSEHLPVALKHASMGHAYDLLLDVALTNSLINNDNGEVAIAPAIRPPGPFEVRPSWQEAVRHLSIGILLICINIKIHVWLDDRNACLLIGELVAQLGVLLQDMMSSSSEQLVDAYHAIAVLTGPLNQIPASSQEAILRTALQIFPDDEYIRADLAILAKQRLYPVS